MAAALPGRLSVSRWRCIKMVNQQSIKLQVFLMLACSFNEKDVQRDAKLVSYDIVDKNGKPYVSVDMGKDKKVRKECEHGLD
eukprot:1155993-Pelagomonas_calceolata.AAC.13